MNVERFSDFETLSALEGDWRRLAQAIPFSGWDWCKGWWNAYGQERELFVLVAKEGERVVGIAPWCMETSMSKGRRIKFLGTGHACTDYVSLLIDPVHRNAVASAFSNWLTQANEQGTKAQVWDFLSFEGVCHADSVMHHFRGAMELKGHTTHDDHALNCWRLNVGTNWEDYFRSLDSKNKRRKVRDLRRKYVDCGRSRFEVAGTSAQFHEFYADFVRLHQMRRTSLGESGCFASDEFCSFLKSVSHGLFESGSLLLSRLTVDGELAAASLGIQNSNIHYMYQTGMNPNLTQSSPGWIMNVHHILHAQHHGWEAIDYLRGDEPYKERLGARQLQMSKFRIVGKRASSAILDGAWQFRSELKQTLPGLNTWLTGGAAATEPH